MKHAKNMLLIMVVASMGFFSSCKKDKKNDPAPTGPTSQAVSANTFVVNGAVQTYTISSRKRFPTSNPTFTQVIVQSAKYSLKLEFSNPTMASGDYTISNSPIGDRNVTITLSELGTSNTMISNGTFSTKVKVSGDNITFGEIVIKDNPKTTLSANITVKEDVTPTPVETKTAMLTGKNWRMIDEENPSAPITCENDDIVTFTAASSTANSGTFLADVKIKCQSDETNSTGTWAFNSTQTKLTTVEDGQELTFDIVELTTSKLRLRYTEAGISVNFTYAAQ